jgi:hypothetical protein
LEKYASKRAKAMYAWIRNFRAITIKRKNHFEEKRGFEKWVMLCLHYF